MKRFIALLILLSFCFESSSVKAETSITSNDIEYKKARALQSKNKKKIATVIDILDRYESCKIPFSERANIKNILNGIINKSNTNDYDKSIAWNYFGYLLFCENNYEAAISAYEKVVNNPKVTYPVRNAALNTLGLLYSSTSNYKPAISTFEKLINGPNTTYTERNDALKYLGQLHYQVKDFSKSVNYLFEYIRTSNKVEPDDYIVLGASYYHSGQVEYAYQSVRRGKAFSDLELIPLSESHEKSFKAIVAVYLNQICDDSIYDELKNDSTSSNRNCINTLWRNDLEVEKEVLGVLIVEGNFNNYNQTPNELMEAEDLSSDCVLCRILTGALIGAIEAYPEAKARAEREKKIREAAYAKGNRDGRRACRNGILC